MYRTESGSTYGSHVVDFDRMTEAAKTRFRECTRKKRSPNPVLADAHDAPGSIRGFTALALIALAGMIGLGAVDFGELTPGHPNQGDPFLAGYALLGVVFAFGALSAARVAIVRGRLPYGPGVYVFPIDIVDARTSHIALHPLRDLKEARAKEGEGGRHEIVLELKDGSTFSFPRKKGDDAVLSDLAEMRDGVQRAVETDDRAMLDQLDPFFEERMAEGWSALRPEGPAPRAPRAPIPGLAVLVPVLALAGGALAGRAFWGLRADMSDRSALSAAASRHDYQAVDAYVEGGGRLADDADTARFKAVTVDGDPAQTRRRLEHYLAHGRLHLDEADDQYFASVRADGTAAAWKAYFENGKRHLAEADDALFESSKKEGRADAFDLYLSVGTKHAGEVKKKLRPLAELEGVKRDPKIGPLHKFLADHPDPEVRAAAQAALHDRYDAARRHYDGLFKDRGPVVALVDQLLTLGEAGKSLVVRLRQFPSKDFAGADEDNVKRNRGRGVRALPYFSAPRDSVRQLGIAHEVLGVFGGVLGDVIDVDSSDGATADDQPLLDVGCEYAPDAPYTYDLTRGVFLSVQATCDTVLKSPGADTPLRFRVKFVPNRLHYTGYTGAAVADNVYEGMMDPLPELIARSLRDLLLPRGVSEPRP